MLAVRRGLDRWHGRGTGGLRAGQPVQTRPHLRGAGNHPATTVVVDGGDERLLPVRTAQPIPRDLHMRAMDDIRHARVTAPVRMGDVVMSDLLGTGVDLVASMDVAAV